MQGEKYVADLKRKIHFNLIYKLIIDQSDDSFMAAKMIQLVINCDMVLKLTRRKTFSQIHILYPIIFRALLMR